MADETIKVAGVKLRLDGQAEFLQNLKVVNQELRTNYQELRLVREQQKLQGTSTETLAQKSDILAREYENQNAKLTGLKQALEKASDEYGANSAEVEKLNTAYKRAEVSTESVKRQIYYNTIELERSKSTLYQTGDAWVKNGKKMQKFGNMANAVGNKLTTHLTVPLMAAAAYSVNAAMDFESAMVGVQKTTDMTEKELEALGLEFRELSKVVPTTAVEFANVAEAAGQLGIEKENIVDFTKVVVDLGNATNIVGEEGAASMAKFANITQMSQKDFERFGSAIVELGNNSATTESDILNMAMRLAAAGDQAGMSEADILGIAAALSSLGLEAEGGGTSFSKLITRIQLAVETGNEDLEAFASVAGMTGNEFKQAFEQDAAGALAVFIQGLGNAEAQGSSTSQILEELEINEVRLSDALRRTAGSGDLLSDSIEMSNDAWEENTALVKEATLRYESSESQLIMNKNRLQDAAITIGQELLPHVVNLTEGIADLAEGFNNLDPETQEFIIKMLGIIALAGPVSKFFGTVVGGLGTLSEVFGNLMKKLADKAAVETATTALTNMGGQAVTASTSVGALTSSIIGPVGLAVGIGALALGLASLLTEADATQKKIDGLKDSTKQIGVDFQGAKADAEAQAQAVGLLGDKLYDLADKTNKTSGEQAIMSQLVGELNEMVPELNLEYDVLNDTLNMSEEEFRKVTDAMKEQIIIDALGESLKEYAKNMGDAGLELLEMESNLEKIETAADNFNTLFEEMGSTAEAQAEIAIVGLEEFIQKTPELQEAFEEWQTTFREIGVSSAETWEQMWIDTATYTEETRGNIEELQGVYDESESKFNDGFNFLQEKMGELSDSDDERTDKAVENSETRSNASLIEVEAQKELAEELLELEDTIAETYSDVASRIESRAREHHASMGTIEQEGIKTSEITAAEVQSNLEQQISDFEEWGVNIQGIAGRVPDDVLYELQQLGPEYAPLIADLNTMTDTELESFVATWRRKSELSVDASVDEFDRMPGEMMGGLDTISRVVENDKKVQNATTKITAKMVERWEKAGGKTKDLAYEIPQDVAISILSRTSLVRGAANTLGSSGVSGFRTTIKSARGSGGDWSIGAISGILSKEGSMESAGRRMGRAVNRGYRNELQIKSPSRKAYQLSGMVVQGHLNRLKEAESEMFEAGENMASSYQSGYDQVQNADRKSRQATRYGQSQETAATGQTLIYVTMNNEISSDYDSDRAIRRLDKGLGQLGARKERGRGRG